MVKIMSLTPTATTFTSAEMPLTSAVGWVVAIFVLVCCSQQTEGQGSISDECFQKCQLQLLRYKFIPPSPYRDSLFQMCARSLCSDITLPSTVTTTATTATTTTTTTSTTTAALTSTRTTTPTTKMSLSSLLFSSVSSVPTSSPTLSSSTRPSTSQTSQESNSTSNIVSSANECGLQQISPHNHRTRIVGGFPAAECEYPWLVHITIRSKDICGGAILDKRRIVTAAHCVVDSFINAPIPVGTVIVRVGSSSTSQAQVHTLVNIVLHPQYDRTAKVNDVAILTIAGEFSFSTCVAPICLPKEGGDPSSQDVCVVAGWGTMDYYVRASTLQLQEVEVPIVEQSLCQRSYDQSRVSDRTLCAGDFYYGGKDSCQGDSGAPLMCLEQGRYVIRGIVSNGGECAKPNYPGIYTRVSHPQVLSFIMQHLEGDQ